ncbi:TPA: DUF2939 domain-containing protein [Acinetobacter baumannii]|uniref:DUF2939 domain-containing protein n=1 Tax=Acinetobacter baumannii TaxID=470 RepID=UPI00148E8300|nr:DUF2939 domain-containing protein [Acinetobacter baumannii]HEE6180586.1 DUF2939 domain-containing protein [Acinetobacter baumannii]HEE6555068.1 DUF2939 domain-containing protein [Acinetobacter baumannii]
MNKKILGSVVALVIAIVGYLYASPYLVLNSIKTAAQNGESEKVSQYIDYPSVRQSFKDQINAMMMKEMANQKDDGFAALGAMLASTMADKMIDGIVTPEGMTLMLKGKNLKDAEQDSQDTQTAETQEQPKPEYEAGYTSMNDFEVVIKDQDQSKQVKVLMARDGLSWKIHKIAVPMD